MNQFFKPKTFSLILMLSISCNSFANQDLFEAALQGDWDRFWGIRISDPNADLDYSEGGVRVRDLVPEQYFDLLFDVTAEDRKWVLYQRPKLWQREAQATQIAVRHARTAEPMDISEDENNERFEGMENYCFFESK